MAAAASAPDTHQARIQDQFTRQAVDFARAQELHNEAALTLLLDCAAPQPGDEVLDVACGPGSVVVAMARRVRRAVGLDSTAAMLEQARQLAQAKGVDNVDWQQGDVYALPFAAASFDLVTCRFASHHFEQPALALAEMLRVCKPGGTVLLCDGIASDDPAKAARFNQMERLRDPSTVEFRPLAVLEKLFRDLGLPGPQRRFFQVPAEREQMVQRAFPAGGDREGLRRVIDESVADDSMGMGARRSGDTVLLDYPAVVLWARKPAPA